MDRDEYRARVANSMAGFYARARDGKIRAPRAPRRQRQPGAAPTEYAEQKLVCQWLKAKRVAYCHVPNGVYHGDPIRGAIQKRVGVKAGVPDLLIFSPPEYGWKIREPRGVAVEMKRRTGGTVSDNQGEWLERLKSCGWAVTVAHGADEAIGWLEGLGY